MEKENNICFKNAQKNSSFGAHQDVITIKEAQLKKNTDLNYLCIIFVAFIYYKINQFKRDF